MSVRSVICMETANTKNSHENNVGESVELDIQENKGTGPQVGLVCRWLQQGGIWGGVGMSFKARVGQAWEEREEESSRRGSKTQRDTCDEEEVTASP